MKNFMKMPYEAPAVFATCIETENFICGSTGERFNDTVTPIIGWVEED